MKQHIEGLIQQALKQLHDAGELPTVPPVVQIEAAKDKQHGDFASNIAMMSAKSAQKKPREMAERILQVLPTSPNVQKVEIAGPGFINFFLAANAMNEVVKQILIQKEQYGKSKIGREKRVIVEFLSSNPTGPLHVGHGRHAAFGAIICNLLDEVGFKTYREYYVNDAGRQMDILAASIWLRYLALCGEKIEFPANGYRGGYVIDIAKSMQDSQKDHFCVSAEKVFANLPPDEPQGGDKEIYIDAVIERAKQLLGDKYLAVFDLGLENIMADIRDEMVDFGVHYDNWFSERQLVINGVVDKMLEKLKARGHTYERDGALWFSATSFGDTKDRVLVRANGAYTYFTNDVAYHLDKLERGNDIAITIMGADHHGYTARIRAALEAMGIDPERLINDMLVQFVSLYRGGQLVQMSTRGGNFVTLRELREEVGNDVARFFYVMRKSEQPMDFDLDLAKAQSNENPVYYIQYAYARICSVFKQLAERDLTFNEANGLANLDQLTEPQERQLMTTLARYPEVIVNAALQYEPHLLTQYMRDLAADFHAYYNAHHFIVDDNAQRDARLALVTATRQVLINGFKLLGITLPESM
jgi:arginyl-tRNA synthetase